MDKDVHRFKTKLILYYFDSADRTLAYTEFTFAVVYTAIVNSIKMVVSLYIH